VVGQEVSDGRADRAAADAVVAGEGGDGAAFQVRGAHVVGLRDCHGAAASALAALGFGGAQAVVGQLALEVALEFAGGGEGLHPEIQAGQEQLIATAESLARRAQRDGSLRADLKLLICGVYYTAAPLLAADPSAWRRYLRLTFDGMCATGTGPLPPALSQDSLLPTIR
jgi:hypothetical protein